MYMHANPIPLHWGTKTNEMKYERERASETRPFRRSHGRKKLRIGKPRKISDMRTNERTHIFSIFSILNQNQTKPNQRNHIDIIDCREKVREREREKLSALWDLHGHRQLN
jgi:hypothetical protein